MDGNQVWVVIVSWNSYQDTADCLGSLASVTWPDLRIVVVDNGSTDGSGDRLAAAFPALTHLRSPQNTGFAGGSNLGIRAALDGGADYICLLNNDTMVDPGFIEPLVARATRTPEAGIIGGKILYDDAENVIWYAGGRIDPRRGFTSHRGQDAPDAPVYDGPDFTDYVTGCLLFARASLYRELGLLDESYFMYCEEVDFCLRAGRAGYRCFYEPGAVIRHRVSRAMGGAYRPVFYYYQTRNLLHAYGTHLKHSPEPGRGGVPSVAALWRYLVVDQSLTLTRAHRTGAAPYVAALWLGFLDYLRHRRGVCRYGWLRAATAAKPRGSRGERP
ncbi:MAG: glycosyltransferase family 2 protein [Thermoleophilia bacterium]